MVGKNKVINIEKLVKSIAADINKLDSLVSEKGEIKDLKSVDFSSLFKGSTAKTLKRTIDRLKRTVEETSKKNQVQVEEISTKIESSLKERQVKLDSGLAELSKTDIKDNAEAKIILDRISENIELSNRRLNELQIEKTAKERMSRIVPEA